MQRSGMLTTRPNSVHCEVECAGSENGVLSKRGVHLGEYLGIRAEPFRDVSLDKIQLSIGPR